MGKKSTPAAPDLSRFADMSERLGTRAMDQQDQQLAWAKEQDAANRAILERVLGTQLPIMEETFRQANEDRQRYVQVFQPLEDSLVKDAMSYDSPERKTFERGRAIGDVTSAFEAQRQNAERQLASFGVDPTTLKAGALDVGMRTAQAAAQAGAATQATQRVEDMGRAMRADAINIGRGMPSQIAQSYGTSLQAGQAGVGGANQTTGTSANALTSGMGYGNQALSGFGQASSITSQGFQNQLARQQAQMAASPWNTVAALGGAALGAAGQAKGFGNLFEEGGIVSEHGALPVSPVPGSTDRKPALLTPGEFVIPDDVVRYKGEEFFHKLMGKAREQRAAIPMG